MNQKLICKNQTSCLFSYCFFLNFGVVDEGVANLFETVYIDNYVNGLHE